VVNDPFKFIVHVESHQSITGLVISFTFSNMLAQEVPDLYQTKKREMEK